MRIWISRAALLGLLLIGRAAEAEIITQLPASSDKRIALTFDACENKTPANLDHSIADPLVAAKIPFTIFVSGRFARHNQADLRELASHDFVEIENHSVDHDNHLADRDDATIRQQVLDNAKLLETITGRTPRYFRFPAGYVTPRAIADVEALGVPIVHWTFASGDPAKSVTPAHLTEWVLSKTKPGSILIFHINGRGWSTGAALPGLIAQLQARGYHFTTLANALR